VRPALSLLPLLLTVACASVPTGPAPAWRAWSARHGGVLPPAEAGPAYARAEGALARIARGCDCAHLTVRVLGDDEPAAFAFRDGSVFVTRGLAELLDPDELAAALAHEVGHLSRRGDGLPGPEAERLADRIGADVLRASGLPPELMGRMLRRLAIAAPRDATLTARIAALEPGPDFGSFRSFRFTLRGESESSESSELRPRL
jgi:Zn-dependent protease with chaperone function